jgi:hypothetical protein
MSKTIFSNSERLAVTPIVPDCDLCLPEHCDLRLGGQCFSAHINSNALDTTLNGLILSDFGMYCKGSTIPRFRSDSWFSVGTMPVRCPNCNTIPLQGYRKAYCNRRGDPYHYWALYCRRCGDLFEPSALDNWSRRFLSSESKRSLRATKAHQ